MSVRYVTNIQTKYRRAIFAGKMYSTISVESARNYFCHGLV